MTEERDRLKYKLYNAASSGMPLSLYTALAEMDPNEANQLLNEVNSKHRIFLGFFSYTAQIRLCSKRRRFSLLSLF